MSIKKINKIKKTVKNAATTACKKASCKKSKTAKLVIDITMNKPAAKKTVTKKTAKKDVVAQKKFIVKVCDKKLSPEEKLLKQILSEPSKSCKKSACKKPGKVQKKPSKKNS